jgi:hypothetical protein
MIEVRAGKPTLPSGSHFWHTAIMKKAITVHQKRRGRPATGRDPAVTIRLPEAILAKVEHWAMAQEDRPPRSQAIRRLVEIGLTVKGPARPSVRKPGRRLRARELAGEAIDKMEDATATPDERSQRRRRLTKGPLEFRDDRVDQPKAKGK